MKSLCVSLETAKALKAAGWTEDTCLAYGKNGYMLEPPFGWSADMDLAFPAPTAEEVLRELPIELTDDAETPLELMVVRDRTYWHVAYAVSEEVAPFSEEYHDKSLSEAAAQMWIWCVKEGHIKTEVKP